MDLLDRLAAKQPAPGGGAVRRAAFALPRELDPEVRHRQIRRTLERAARVPTEIAEAASGIATEAVELTERGNCNLRGDAFTAATLAAAVARAAAELVRLNVELGDLGGDLADRAADVAADAVAVLSGSRTVAGAAR